MRRASRGRINAFLIAWGKNQWRENRRAQHAVVVQVFAGDGARIARSPTRTKLARGLFDRGNSVLDRGATVGFNRASEDSRR